MRAMILAAGRGERMRPLTDQKPKPMVELAGRPLIVHSLHRLRAAGIRDIVINLGWMGAAIRDYLGDGAAFDMRIQYSEEGWPALDTGGGVQRALPLLGPAPFLLVNADVYSETPLASLVATAEAMPAQDLAHLLLVPNPPHHPQGDFGIEAGRLRNEPRTHTFSGLSVLRPELFASSEPGCFSLVPLLRKAAAEDRLGGSLVIEAWSDIGTPQRLQELQRRLGVYLGA